MALADTTGCILFIVVVFFVHLILDLILDKLASVRKPPRSVKYVELCELVFGTLVLASSAYFFVVERSKTGAQIAILIGVLWWIMAAAIYLGKRWARTLCVVLSIVRIITIIGIPFSFISLYAIFFSEKCREYFSKNNTVGTGGEIGS